MTCQCREPGCEQRPIITLERRRREGIRTTVERLEHGGWGHHWYVSDLRHLLDENDRLRAAVRLLAGAP